MLFVDITDGQFTPEHSVSLLRNRRSIYFGIYNRRYGGSWVSDFKEKKCRHLKKHVSISDSLILEESDIYYGIKNGEYYNWTFDSEKKGYEHIIIEYSYQAERRGANPWRLSGRMLKREDFPTSL